MEEKYQLGYQPRPPENLVQNFFIVVPNGSPNVGLTGDLQTESILQAIRSALGGAAAEPRVAVKGATFEDVGSALTKEEVREVTAVVRRISAIVLMSDQLNANYIFARDSPYDYSS